MVGKKLMSMLEVGHSRQKHPRQSDLVLDFYSARSMKFVGKTTRLYVFLNETISCYTKLKKPVSVTLCLNLRKADFLYFGFYIMDKHTNRFWFLSAAAERQLIVAAADAVSSQIQNCVTFTATVAGDSRYKIKITPFNATGLVLNY